MLGRVGAPPRPAAVGSLVRDPFPREVDMANGYNQYPARGTGAVDLAEGSSNRSGLTYIHNNIHTTVHRRWEGRRRREKLKNKMSGTNKNNASKVSAATGVTNAPKQKGGEGEKVEERKGGEKGGETVLTGGGTGASTPTDPGMLLRSRPRVGSVGSIDYKLANVELWNREEARMERAASEMSDYVGRNFSKDKHEAYFEKRLGSIRESIATVREEYERTARMVGRIASLEERVAGAVRRMGEIETVIMEKLDEVTGQGVIEKVKEAVGKAMEQAIKKGREDVEVMMKLMDEERKEMGKLEDRLKAKIEVVVGKAIKTSGLVEKNVVDAVNVGSEKVCEKMDSVGREVVRKMGDIGKAKEGVGISVQEVEVAVSKAIKECGMEKEVGPQEAPGTPGSSKGSWSQVVRRGARGPRVAVKPGEGDTGGRRGIREKLVTIAGSREADVKVKRVWREGEGLVVEVHDQADAERLRTKVQEVGLRVSNPIAIDPWVRLEGVDVGIKKEDLAEVIWIKNGRELGVDEETFKREFRPVRMMGRVRLGRVGWIVRVSPRLWRKLMEMKDMLYVGLGVVRVEDHIDVLRCWRCNGFGHVGARCGSQRGCMRCGRVGHEAKDCTSQEVGCSNCIKSGKQGDHMVLNPSCPLYQAEIRRLKNLIHYD